jgi:hypothetical protein
MSLKNYTDIDRVDDQRKVELANFLEIVKRLAWLQRTVELLEEKMPTNQIFSWLQDKKELLTTWEGYCELMSIIKQMK